MYKEIEIPSLTLLSEPSMFLVRPGYHEKYASTKISSEIYKELEDFKGRPNKSYMLVVAVSPLEYWGPNKNNDAFEEFWLKKKHGTFVTDGTFYKNHVNKDPSKNYGSNIRSWYDDEMKRVLVLIEVDNNKAPDIVQDLENGKRLSVSMGCRIASDVCSICGNKAPTRAQYCDHMKFQAGKILPDGRRVYVTNPDPTFFDLSKVVKPAGHIEYMIKVVKPKSIEEQDREPIVIKTTTITTKKDMPIDSIEAFMSGRKVANVTNINKVEHINKVADVIPGNLFNTTFTELSEEDDRLGPDRKIDSNVIEGIGSEKAKEENNFSEKVSTLKKLCTIDKVINGDVLGPSDDIGPSLKKVIEKSKNIINLTSPEELDDPTIHKLSEHPLKDIFSTLNNLGINLTVPETCKIIIIKRKEPEVQDLISSVLSETGPNILEDIFRSGGPLRYLNHHPRTFKIIIRKHTVTSEDDGMDEKIAQLMVPWLEKRSNFPYFLAKRPLTKIGRALRTIPIMDSEGTEYLTTQDALDRASEMQLLKNSAKVLGVGALATGTGLAMYHAPKLLPKAWEKFLGLKTKTLAGLGGLAGGAYLANEALNSGQPSTLVNMYNGEYVPSDILLKKMGSQTSEKIADLITKTYPLATIKLAKVINDIYNWTKAKNYW